MTEQHPMRTGYPMQTVMWPEGQPMRAAFPRGVFKDWWQTLRWSLEGKRTCRLHGWNISDPIDAARRATTITGE